MRGKKKFGYISCKYSKHACEKMRKADSTTRVRIFFFFLFEGKGMVYTRIYFMQHSVYSFFFFFARTSHKAQPTNFNRFSFIPTFLFHACPRIHFSFFFFRYFSIFLFGGWDLQIRTVLNLPVDDFMSHLFFTYYGVSLGYARGLSI